MRLVRQVFFPDAATATRVLWWGVGLVGFPLALFILWTVWQAPSRLEELQPVAEVGIWQEDVGTFPFDQPSLERLALQHPEWSAMEWLPDSLPSFIELGTAVDLPRDAPKRRVWFRIPVPDQDPAAQHGRLGLLGFRVQGGPWSVWADGRLIQSNLSDWRIQWNVPLKVTIPLDAKEVLLSVPYVAPLGYSVGSMRIGPIDVVESAWQERNLLHTLMPKLMMAIAAVLTWVSIHLAILRRRDVTFRIMAANALMLLATSVQWAWDVTGQDVLTVWYSSAVDSSITWLVVLLAIFAFEAEGIGVPRIRIGLVLYAAVSTVMTLPMWDWQMNALMAQHYFNAATYALVLWVMGVRAVHQPTRTAVALWLAMALQLVLGVHTLQNLTNQTNPDSFYSFPMTSLVLYVVFTYVLMRRSALAMNESEAHEATLVRRLDEQQVQLSQQHLQLQRLEVEKQLATQHESIMQDLHDRLGSNLTTALMHARSGRLSADETVLLLQELTDELRHLSRSTPHDQRTLNQILAEIRQRVEHRLRHGGIVLEWAVSPDLPSMADTGVGQHLRAAVSEAIANAIKHASPTRIRVEAHQLPPGEIRVAVLDNGVGFDPESVQAGRGLPGLGNRAEAMSSVWRLQSEPGRGTCWEVIVPTDGATG